MTKSKKDKVNLHVADMYFTIPTGGHQGQYSFCEKKETTYSRLSVALALEELIEWSINLVRSIQVKKIDPRLYIPFPNPRNESITKDSLSNAMIFLDEHSKVSVPEAHLDFLKTHPRLGHDLILDFDHDLKKWVFSGIAGDVAMASLKSWAIFANLVLRDAIMLDSPRFAIFRAPKAQILYLEDEVKEHLRKVNVNDEQTMSPMVDVIPANSETVEMPNLEKLACHLKSIGPLSSILLEDDSIPQQLRNRLRVLIGCIGTTNQALTEEGVIGEEIPVAILDSAEANAKARLETLAVTKRKELEARQLEIAILDIKVEEKKSEVDKREKDLDAQLATLSTKKDELESLKSNLETERLRLSKERDSLERDKSELKIAKDTHLQKVEKLQEISISAGSILERVAKQASQNAKAEIIKLLSPIDG